MQIQAFWARVKKPAAAVFGVLVILLLLGFYALPKLIIYQLPRLVEQQLNRKASLKAMTFNPISLKIGLLGFQIDETDGQPFVAFEKLDIDVDGIQSIAKLALKVDAIVLAKPFIHIKRNKNGEFNFASLIKPSGSEKTDDKTKFFPLVISRLAIEEGQFFWEDEFSDQPLQEQIKPIDLVIQNFSTTKASQFEVAISLDSSLAGHFNWQGKAGIFPLASKGQISLSQINLERLQKILQTPIRLAGQAGVDVSYDLSSTAGNDLKFLLEKANINVKGLRYSDSSQSDAVVEIASVDLATAGEFEQVNGVFSSLIKQGSIVMKAISLSDTKQKLAEINDFKISGINVDINHQTVALESLETGHALIKAWLTSEGINYSELFGKSQSETDQTRVSSNQSSTAEKPWTLLVNNLALTEYALEFQDRTLKQPVTFNISPIRLQAKNFHSGQLQTKLPFEFAANINKTSLISLQGTVVPENLKSDIAVKVKDFRLPFLQSYVEPFLRIDLVDGTFSAEGQLELDKPVEKPPRLSFKGQAAINRFVTRDQLQNKDLVKWQNLSLKDISVDWPEQTYRAESLTIDKPYVRAIIEKDKTNNFQDIIISKTSSTKIAETGKTSVASKDTAKPPAFSLSHIIIKNGSSDFADLSLILPFAAKINALDGGLDGVSSEKNAKVKLNLKGSAYDLAPVLINGSISPNLGDFDISLDFKGMPMPLMSPYVVQFAGYKVEKGKLYLTLNYKVENNQLTAGNTILIDQLELGEKVDNPNAASIPMELAIALLKDSDGKINIDVPVTGSLEDPQFDIGNLIFDALVNAISKVVTAPFSALASWLDSDQDLSMVDFSAGKTELAEPEKKKLDDLAKALKEKTGLQLEIKGQAYEKADWPALTDAALYDWLKQLKVSELGKAGKNVREENIELSDEDYKRLLTQLFLQKFPLLAETSLLGTPKLIDPSAGDFYQVARDKLGETIRPEQKRLKELAADRAQTIAKYLVQQGGVPNERVFILDSVVNPNTTSENGDVKSNITALLSLKAN
ncbi:MAG: membrane biogenesis protein [Methylobacter sp.]|nr:MAG: membrane biogenesis protein [Methylobacter sp.]